MVTHTVDTTVLYIAACCVVALWCAVAAIVLCVAAAVGATVFYFATCHTFALCRTVATVVLCAAIIYCTVAATVGDTVQCSVLLPPLQIPQCSV